MWDTESNIESLIRESQQFSEVVNVMSSPRISDDLLYTTTVDTGMEVPESFDRPITQQVPEDCEQVKIDEIRVNTSRFSGATWFNKIQEQNIIVGGQGGISSWFTFLAARMFPNSIYTYDPDTVEMVNLAGQLFCKNDIGMYKGDAVARTVAKYSDYKSIFSINERFPGETAAGKIMVCGFDNMEARKLFYSSWKELANTFSMEDRKELLFIDGRLSAESIQIFAMTGDAGWDLKEYEEKYLFDDADADEAICSYKQTAFVANIIGGLMVNILVNFCANLCGGCRAIPFYTQYEADQMYLKLEGGV